MWRGLNRKNLVNDMSQTNATLDRDQTAQVCFTPYIENGIECMIVIRDTAYYSPLV